MVVGLIDFIALEKTFLFWISHIVHLAKGAIGWAAFIFGNGYQRSDLPRFWTIVIKVGYVSMEF